MTTTTRAYTVKVAQDAPDFESGQVARWLDEQIARNAPLAADPGAGDKVLRFTVNSQKLQEGMRSAGEMEAAVFIRRVIATYGGLKPEERKSEVPPARPKPAEVPERLRLKADQLAPLMQAYDYGQAFAISQVMRVPEAMQAARLTAEEREQLAVATAELANRRASKWPWLIENIDILGFSSLLLSIEFRKVDAVLAVKKRLRGAKPAPVIAVTPQPQPAETQQAEKTQGLGYSLDEPSA